MRAVLSDNNPIEDSPTMQITLITNPRSGRGNARRSTQMLQDELTQRNHTVHVVETGSEPSSFLDQITESDRVVIIGGDGTVHHLLPILTQTQTPMYHLGTGTANLICKEFGMSQDPIQVAGHLEHDFEPTVVDVPSCNGVPFLIMVSLGIDASVIHRFEESRKHKGGYRAYIQPIFRELISPRYAQFQVEFSGTSEQPPYQETGNLIIANLRSYGGRLNPCPNANCNDGLIDLISIPCRSSIKSALNNALFRVGKTPRECKRDTASSITITTTQGSAFVQVDGEKATRIPGLHDGRLAQGQHMRIEMCSQHLYIHAPKPRNPER